MFHDRAISIYGRTGFSNPGYLESAIAQPQQHWYYNDGGCDLFDLAAVYLYHVAKGHAFVDGNKRTGYMTALVFLGLNRIDLLLPANFKELAQATERAAGAGPEVKPELAALMRQMPRDLDSPLIGLYLARTPTKRKKPGKSRRKQRSKRKL